MQKFTKFGYGYRLYVDDLPSATKINGQTSFGSTIPLGYFKEQREDQPPIDGEGLLQEVNIFNHLEITIEVHETMSS